MSYKPEMIAEYNGNWTGNALRFATEAEAHAYAQDLASRWTSVRDVRVVESEEPVNYRWTAYSRLERLDI